MDIGKAFTYVFDDEKWVTKALMGALFMLLGFLLSPILIGLIFIFMLGGYLVELVRNVANGDLNPLPDWNNLGAKLGKGFMLFLVTLVYAIPMIVLLMCAMLPLFFVSSTTGGQDSSASSGFAAIATIISLVGYCLVTIYGLVLTILTPAIVIRYATTESFGACFQFGQMLRFITANLGNYIIVVLLSIVAGFIGQLGTIVCVIGLFATLLYAMLIEGHLYGQLYRVAQAQGTGFGSV